jgi:hypothetical protein
MWIELSQSCNRLAKLKVHWGKFMHGFRHTDGIFGTSVLHNFQVDITIPVAPIRRNHHCIAWPECFHKLQGCNKMFFHVLFMFFFIFHSLNVWKLSIVQDVNALCRAFLHKLGTNYTFFSLVDWVTSRFTKSSFFGPPPRCTALCGLGQKNDAIASSAKHSDDGWAKENREPFSTKKYTWFAEWL